MRYIDPSHFCSPYVGVDLLFDRDGDAVAESERFRDLVEHQLEHLRPPTRDTLRIRQDLFFLAHELHCVRCRIQPLDFTLKLGDALVRCVKLWDVI